MLRAVALSATVVLAACTTPQSLQPGTPEVDVRAALGRPTASVALPGGGSRLQYSGQPFNQSVWNADFDGSGRLLRVDQMMSDESFARIASGKATRDEVLRDFGPPAEVYQFKLKNESAWMYRYFTHGGFKAAMFVYFDPAGIVKRTETGMDPWSIRDGDRNQ
jgi:hypothetical protein